MHVFILTIGDLHIPNAFLYKTEEIAKESGVVSYIAHFVADANFLQHTIPSLPSLEWKEDWSERMTKANLAGLALVEYDTLYPEETIWRLYEDGSPTAYTVQAQKVYEGINL